MRHNSEIEKTKEIARGQGDRLVALQRLLSYAVDEAEKTGSPFVRYCVTLARDSVIAELGERRMTIPTESLGSLATRSAAIGGH